MPQVGRPRARRPPDSLPPPHRTPLHSDHPYRCPPPLPSINFVTAHDGFTLEDLVSYGAKQNVSNGEENRDGDNANHSFDCGHDGPSTEPPVLMLRERSKRTLLACLLLAQGTPMLLAGDEMSLSRQGNNNTWCHDGPVNYVPWSRLLREHRVAAFHRFARSMIALRRVFASFFRRRSFLSRVDVEWHGVRPSQADWSVQSRVLACTFR